MISLQKICLDSSSGKQLWQTEISSGGFPAQTAFDDFVVGFCIGACAVKIEVGYREWASRQGGAARQEAHDLLEVVLTHLAKACHGDVRVNACMGHRNASLAHFASDQTV